MHHLQQLIDHGAHLVRLARGEKRPLGAAWQTRATQSLQLVSQWLRQGSNVGLLLGPTSGLIDVEFDEPEGADEVQALGLDVVTPTWQSARGVHRLFRWDDRLPLAATRKLGALELRLGGRAAQSVLPPSCHPTGCRYEWITPPSVPVAALPAHLVELMQEEARQWS
jgi:hypothetical protein